MIEYLILEADAKTHVEAHRHRLPGQKRKITLLVCIFKAILVMARNRLKICFICCVESIFCVNL